MPHLRSRLPISVSSSSSENHDGKVKLAEHRVNFGLEICESLLIAFDCFGVILKTDATLVGKNNNDVTVQRDSSARYQGHGSKTSKWCSWIRIPPTRPHRAVSERWEHKCATIANLTSLWRKRRPRLFR